MRLFKGASAGSYWFIHDPRTNNGFQSSPGVQAPASIVAHITNYSHPSPYLSFTASPAIARGYALPFGGTAAGRIYEIETDKLDKPLSGKLFDPVTEITQESGPLHKFSAPYWATHHDGDALLLAAVAAAQPPPSPVSHRRNTQRSPWLRRISKRLSGRSEMRRYSSSATYLRLASSTLGTYLEGGGDGVPHRK